MISDFDSPPDMVQDFSESEYERMEHRYIMSTEPTIVTVDENTPNQCQRPVTTICCKASAAQQVDPATHHHDLSVDPWGHYSDFPSYNQHPSSPYIPDNHSRSSSYTALVTPTHDHEQAYLYDAAGSCPSNEGSLLYPLQSVDSSGPYAPRDVLCGRGALMAWHPGNKAFRQLIKNHREMYLLAGRREKPHIAHYIIKVIVSSGGRFLKEGVNGEEWVDIGYNKAYDKTTQALREGAPKLRERWRQEKQEHQDNSSSTNSSSDE